MEDLLQIAGALGVLVPFVLLQARRMDATSLPYLVPNFAGSAVLAVLAAMARDWGFLLLEVVWAAVAAFGILMNLTGRGKGAPVEERA